MNVFDIRNHVLDDYKSFVQSFIKIKDAQVEEAVGAALESGDLWPEALIQLNPAYKRSKSTEDLIDEKVFHSKMKHVFPGFKLYQHQVEALERGEARKPFIVTSGTGSGKSLAFFGTIINHVLRNPEPAGVRAIIIYPMNALINSQENEFQEYAENYKRQTGRDLPVRVAKYTGQEGSDARHRVMINPPHILLTNFMMMEYIMMRGAERKLRKNIGRHLEFLVYDELHTYRGRQGADVALLNRRLQAAADNDLQFIGTSATMVSGVESGVERRQIVADVGSTLFGVEVSADNIIEEALTSTFQSDESTLKEDLVRELKAGVSVDASGEELLSSPTAYWLESRIGLKDDEGEFRRRKPHTLSEIAAKLSEFSGEEEEKCADYLKNFLEWVNRVNIDRVQAKDKRELFPFKLHQFIAQSGSVYSTLAPRGQRLVTLEAGVSLRSDESGEEQDIYPIVFSRSSGWDYYVVAWDRNTGRLSPRDFSSRVATGIEEEDEVLLPDNGYIVIDLDDSGEPLFDLETARDDLPSSWFTASGKPKKSHAHKVPQRVWLAEDGRCSEERTTDHTIGGFFIGTPMAVDVTTGEIYTSSRSDYAKLTTLGSEARSTSTTILSSALIDRLGESGQAAKTLCFTDNRQDASLQAGHFNDFGRVIAIRGALVRALKQYPDGLTFQTLGQRMREHIGLEESEYALSVDPNAPIRKNQEVFEDLLTLRALEDLQRGWRIVLPNLEQSGRLRVDFVGLDELANHSRWNDFEPLKDATPQQRKQLIYDIATYFRTEYSIRLEMTERSQLRQFEKLVSETIRPEWGVSESHMFKSPTPFTFARTSNVKHPGTRSLGYQSTLGRYLREHPLLRDHLASRDEYDEIIPVFLSKLQGALLRVDKTNLRGGGEGLLYYVDGKLIRWLPGDGQVPDTSIVRSRRLATHTHDDTPNEYFSNKYGQPIRRLHHANDHTAQVSNDDRQDRERAFRNGELNALYCSPTMELGIDIADLSVVQMRNIPPNPASYIQRSGRAGRGGQAALVVAYAAHRSPHDQAFFNNRIDMVSGVVDAPSLDLSNEALVKTHIHARYVLLVDLDSVLKADDGTTGIGSLLNLNDNHYPLRDEVADQLQLSSVQRERMIAFGKEIVASLGEAATRFDVGWIERTVDALPIEFDSALDRWRKLFRANRERLLYAQKVQSDFSTRYSQEDKTAAEIEVKRCSAQMNQLLARGGRNNDNEFYPYRYLATEGFLPGYNFPTRPIRAQVRVRHDTFDYIGRSRQIGIREFGPLNVIYHHGGKHRVDSVTIEKNDQLSFILEKPMVSKRSGYVFMGGDETRNTDPILGVPLSGDGAQEALPRSARLIEVRTSRREYISCEEEERVREGFDMETHFAVDDTETLKKAPRIEIYEDDLRLIDIRLIAPARLYHFNLGWLRETENGYNVSQGSGIILRGKQLEKAVENEEAYANGIGLYTDEVADAIFIQPLAALGLDQDGVTTLQYAFERALVEVFSVESRELSSLTVGEVEGRPNLLIYESSEGSLGVLQQLFGDPNKFRAVIEKIRSMCAFDDPDEDERRPRASYRDLLSYSNQRHHDALDRNLIREATERLQNATVRIKKVGQRSYDEQYRALLDSYDRESAAEKRFLDYLYKHRLALPDSSQKHLAGIYAVPDFYYDTFQACVFIDGSVHDSPEIREKDTIQRKMLKDKGYEVVAWYYKESLDELVEKYDYIFKPIES